MNQIVPALIQKNVPLHEKNWFRTGGPAAFFCEPTTAQEFQQALAFAKEQELSVFVLGEGANILISDEGFDGLVIRPALHAFNVTKESETTAFVTVGAGVSMNDLIEKTLSSSLYGLEVFSGIPGTVGGSAYINLHYFTHFLSHFITKAQVIEKATGNILDVETDWFKFGYNQSTLIAGDHYLINLTLQLPIGLEADIAYARGRRYEIIRHRMSRYPSSHTCGSFFRNFHDDEVTLIWNGKKMIYIAFYLDKLGVKGTETVGGACVSWQHANMLVNKNNATSADIVTLARVLQQKVKDQFGIVPQSECIFVGFKNYPLITE